MDATTIEGERFLEAALAFAKALSDESVWPPLESSEPETYYTSADMALDDLEERFILAYRALP